MPVYISQSDYSLNMQSSSSSNHKQILVSCSWWLTIKWRGRSLHYYRHHYRHKTWYPLAPPPPPAHHPTLAYHLKMLLQHQPTFPGALGSLGESSSPKEPRHSHPSRYALRRIWCAAAVLSLLACFRTPSVYPIPSQSLSFLSLVPLSPIQSYRSSRCGYRVADAVEPAPPTSHGVPSTDA